MIKKILVFHLLMTAAVTTYAAEDSFKVANIDKNSSRLQIKSRAIPPLVTEKYQYYEIRGNNEKDLRYQMTQNGSTWDDGKKYDSVTSWNVTWDYGYDRTPQACAPDSFRPNIEIVFRFPKWVRTNDAPQSLVNKWDGYMKNLIIHEKGHRDMVVEAANELSHAVAELQSSSSCADLDRKVLVLCRKWVEKLNADEKAYDDATVHGATQGALFP